MTERSLSGASAERQPPPFPQADQKEAWRRFNEASKGFALLVGTDCRPERLERAGEVMDLWARRLS